MDETTNLCVEIMTSKRQVMDKLGHVVKISSLLFDVNVMLNLSRHDYSSKIGIILRFCETAHLPLP